MVTSKVYMLCIRMGELGGKSNFKHVGMNRWPKKVALRGEDNKGKFK